MKRTGGFLRTLIASGLCLSAVAAPAQADESGDWMAYGRDAGGARHSPLVQITRENVAGLELAWTFRTGELDHIKGTNAWNDAAFEATPLVIEGRMYFSAPTGRAFALDAETGKEIWRFDPQTDLKQTYSEVTSRGVSSWAGDVNGKRQRRIFLPTLDARLFALDAETGKPCADFAAGGVVNLKEGVGKYVGTHYQVTSPPAIIGDRLVIGSSMGDNRRLDAEHGVVRAFDVRTGKMLWSWDPIPRSADDPRAATWKGPKAFETGAANVWSVIAADPERDLVFLPTTSPSPDFYGGERIGKTEDANSVVAIRASTGEVAWRYQVVHHDIWDYDIASPPALVTVRREGKEIPALFQTTKMGHLFVLNRETGEPLFPVEERPVPKSDVQGEEAWPTQPFPARLPLLGLRELKPEDAWGPTEADREGARKRIEGMRNEGIFTPLTITGTIITPGNIGGSNWGGVSFDPARGIVVVSTNRIATLAKLVPRSEWIKEWRGNQRAEVSPQSGTPYGISRESFHSPARLPGSPPPWGVLTAVDLATGDRKWEIPLGWMADPNKYADAKKWGSVNMGGAITTASGLVFMAGTYDNHLRAFDIETGKELWAAELPASAQATPMTYAGKDGRQYVAICAGGHGKMGTKRGDSVAVYALKKD